MRTSATILLASITYTLSGNSFAFMEIPFCPGGGPPGWFNYINHKLSLNKPRYQNYYPSSYPPVSDNQYQYPPYDYGKPYRAYPNAAFPYTALSNSGLSTGHTIGHRINQSTDNYTQPSVTNQQKRNW